MAHPLTVYAISSGDLDWSARTIFWTDIKSNSNQSRHRQSFHMLYFVLDTKYWILKKIEQAFINSGINRFCEELAIAESL